MALKAKQLRHYGDLALQGSESMLLHLGMLAELLLRRGVYFLSYSSWLLRLGILPCNSRRRTSLSVLLPRSLQLSLQALDQSLPLISTHSRCPEQFSEAGGGSCLA